MIVSRQKQNGKKNLKKKKKKPLPISTHIFGQKIDIFLNIKKVVEQNTDIFLQRPSEMSQNFD